MCFRHPGIPFTMVLDQRILRNGNLLLFYGLVFGKVTAYRNGMHRTANDFQWPIGRTAVDPRAIVGDHTYGLHYLASPACAPLYDAYDSHVLAVFPSAAVWDELVLPTPATLKQPQQLRCWHSNKGTTLQCLTCANVKLDVLTDPDYLRDLQRPRGLPGGLSINKLLASNNVWYRSVEMPGN